MSKCENSLEKILIFFDGVKKETKTPAEIFMTIKHFLGSALLQGQSLILHFNASVTVSERSVYV